MLSSKKVKKEEPLKGKGKHNPFAALETSDSDSEEEQEEVVITEEKPKRFVRDWETVRGNDMKVIFSKSNKKNHEKTHSNGWTSIAWSKPRFEDVKEDEEEKKIREERLQDLVEVEDTSPKTPPVYEDVGEGEEKEKVPAQIKDWAVKIRESLEKAEKEKPKAKENALSEDFISSLGKLSFFRKPMTVEN